LKVIARWHFPLHTITKSDLVTRDLDLLERIKQVYAAVSFTITTADDDLARRLEPGAPLPSARFAAMRALAERGITTGVTLMPVLPFIEDTPENITAIVEKSHQCGARYILPAFGMTLRDRQRDYFYRQLDRLFPGVRQKYQAAYGDRYSADVPGAKALYSLFERLCQECSIPTRMPFYQPALQASQLKLSF
jgi:DNA repair photolyase